MYEAINAAVLRKVPETAKRLLDIGCGSGALGRALKLRSAGETRVAGVTFDPLEAEAAAKELDEVVVADLNHFDPAPLGRFDTIICSHVLEHLHRPDQFLCRLHDCLTPDGILVVALPNALFWKQRLEFLLGRFRYTHGGLMDETHLRFYDWTSARRLMESSQFQILSAQADGHVPFTQHLGVAGAELSKWALRSFPGLFGFQFVFSAHSRKSGSPC